MDITKEKITGWKMNKGDISPNEFRSLCDLAIDGLGARSQEGSRDAARYRWLRQERDEQQPVVTIARQNTWGVWRDVPLWGDELDSAIDAASPPKRGGS